MALVRCMGNFPRERLLARATQRMNGDFSYRTKGMLLRGEGQGIYHEEGEIFKGKVYRKGMFYKLHYNNRINRESDDTLRNVQIFAVFIIDKNHINV